MKKLTPEQLEIVKKEMIKSGEPVRFLQDGCNLNISTGATMSRGVNVMYHIVYWNFSKETSMKIANWLGVKAVF